MKDESNERDIFRRAPVRFLGYANEIGEAFREQIGAKWVGVSYGVATAYALADTAYKGHKAFQNNKHSNSQINRTLFTTADTLIWQMLASVILPGFTINRICAFSNYVLRDSKVLPQTTKKWVVTGIGLAMIPVIIRPIDNFVDDLLDLTFRKLKP